MREEHLRNDFFVEYFLLFGVRFKCGRIIYWFFDMWVEFCEKLLGANFMVFGRSSLLYFCLSGDLGFFLNYLYFRTNDHGPFFTLG